MSKDDNMKPIPFAKEYYISESGVVYSKKTGQPMKQNIMHNGYARLGLFCDGDVKQKNFLVHRLVTITYIDNPLNKEEVNHKDGDKLNNHVSNLEWVTREENQKHAFANNLNTNKGIFNGRATLNEKQVIEIYSKLLDGARSVDLAKEYGIGGTVVGYIRNKRIWQDLLKDLPEIPYSGRGRLSESKVRWVCSELEKGSSEVWIKSKALGITAQQILSIKCRKSYTYISDDYCW